MGVLSAQGSWSITGDKVRQGILEVRHSRVRELLVMMSLECDHVCGKGRKRSLVLGVGGAGWSVNREARVWNRSSEGYQRR